MQSGLFLPVKSLPCVGAGVISSVGVHTEREWGFTPVQGYDKNVTYSNGRCPARALMDQLLEFVQARAHPCCSFPCASMPGCPVNGHAAAAWPCM